MNKRERGRQRYLNLLKGMKKIFEKQKSLEQTIVELQEELTETQRILMDYIKNN